MRWARYLWASPILLYLLAVNAPFFYDDFHSIAWNPAVKTLEQWWTFFTDPNLFSVMPDKAMYRPLLMLSYALNYQMVGMQAWAFRIPNLALHVATAACVGAMAAQWTRRAYSFAIAAFLFLIHPAFSEPAFYISSRSEVGCVLFGWMCLLAYQRGQAAQAVLWAACSVGFKETGAVVFAMCWCYEILLGRRWKDRKAWLSLLAVTSVCVGYVAWTWHFGTITASVTGPVRSWAAQFYTQLAILPTYCRQLLFPWRWGLELEAVERTAMSVQAVLGLLIVAGAFCWAIRSGRRSVFLLGCVLLTMLPTSIFPLNIIATERRLYWAGGFFIVGVVSMLDRKNVRVAVVLWAAMLAAMLGLRATVWADDLSLWKQSIAEHPNSYRMSINAGAAAINAKDYPLARSMFTRALILSGDDAQKAMVWNNIAGVYFAKGQLDSALAGYLVALQLDSLQADSWANLGCLWGELGKHLEGEAKATHYLGAESYLRHALAIDSTLFQPHRALADVLRILRRPEEAKEEYRLSEYYKREYAQVPIPKEKKR